MKTYFPYYFKRIGILFVFVAFILSCFGNIDDFNRGWLSAGKDLPLNSIDNPDLDKILNYNPYFTKDEAKPWLNGSLILSLLGFTLYLFSKEKIEDEFYQQLRAKSLMQALFITWIFTGLVYWLIPEFDLEGFYILQLHLIFFTMIYAYNRKVKFGTE
ncbi:hypothetical protein [Marinifilum flexuosum]|uniref:hypothetical protein n=1 Tax=Marinifilum flexuosum TaxID=1117708 RepID=UPI002491BDD0|nr:hypothetical protein [Marinifilum flexuosum]